MLFTIPSRDAEFNMVAQEARLGFFLFKPVGNPLLHFAHYQNPFFPRNLTNEPQTPFSPSTSDHQICKSFLYPSQKLTNEWPRAGLAQQHTGEASPPTIPTSIGTHALSGYQGSGEYERDR
jgi:hypothetical protein